MKNRNFVKPVILFAAFIFSMKMGQVQTVTAADDETINKGVYISDINVSGMTAEEAKAAVNSKIDSLGSRSIILKADDATVSTTVRELGLYWNNEDVVNEAVNLGKSGNIIKRYKDNKDLETENKEYQLEFAADESTVRSYVQNQCTQLNREAENAGLTRENGYFEVVPGVVGLTIDVDKSTTAITEYINQEWNEGTGTITLVAEEVQPEGTAEELSKVQDVLGTATTSYGGSTSGRAQNVENGTAKLNGQIIYPGETFSVTQAVIPFDAENGYELAASYESGKVVDTYGGGICQVSTTLYNALLKAELEIVERHNHTMTVSYVDPSKDAAIAEGLMDLQFSNNTETPIYIEGSAYGGQVTFTVYGMETRSADRTVTYVSETTSVTDASGVKLYAKSDANVGYISQIQSPHQGLTAVLWKDVTENGETTRTQVNSSNYQATPTSYDIGIQSSDANVVAAIQAAINANDLAAVQSIIAGGVSTPSTETETPETQASESQSDQSESSESSESGETDSTESQDSENSEGSEEGEQGEQSEDVVEDVE